MVWPAMARDAVGLAGLFGAVNASAPKLTGGMVGGEGLEPPTFSV